MISKSKVKQLDRIEHIRLEAKAAQEHGMVPKRPLSQAANFRVEMSSPTLLPQHSSLAPTHLEVEANDSDFRVGVRRAQLLGATRTAKEIASGRAPDIRTAKARILSELKKLDRDNQEQLLPRLLEQANIIAAASKDDRIVRSLQRSIGRVVLGDKPFKNRSGKDGGGRSSR